jgi:hypothetical protein
MGASLDDGDYGFRFNHVRQKGRGWSLAGIEIVSVRGKTPAPAQAKGGAR